MKKLRILTIIFLLSFLLNACTNNASVVESEDKLSQDEKSEIEIENIMPVENERDIDLQYVDNQRYEFLDGFIIEEVMYYAVGEYGEYFFTPGDWTNEFMLHLVAVSEDGVKFAKDWLNYEDDKRVVFVYGNMKHDSPTNPDSFIQQIWGGGGVMGNHEVFINMADEHMPAHIVHEACHAILRMQGRMSNFPFPNENSGAMFLEEGLCTVIEYLFSLETEHIYHLYTGYDIIKLYYPDDAYKMNKYEPFKEITASQLHEMALISFVIDDNFEDETEFGLIYPQLMSYGTAASFVYYLLEYKGTKEDFMRVYDDIHLMNEVYGVNMEAMIVEWLEFLEQYR